MGHHDTHQLDVKEYIAKYEKFKWMLTLKDTPGLLGNLLQVEEKPTEIPEFKDFYDNTLSNVEKLHFVLLALEKLHHVHPAAIPREDSKYLHTAKIGVLYSIYYYSLWIPLIFMNTKMILSRKFNAKFIGGLFSYMVVMDRILMPCPLYYKEWVRRMRARPIAMKYFEKENGKLDLFKKILDPRTHPHELHHMKL